MIARICAGVNGAGCATTIVFTESVAPRRAAMAPPKQYLDRNMLVRVPTIRVLVHQPNSTDPLVALLSFNLRYELYNPDSLVGSKMGLVEDTCLLDSRINDRRTVGNKSRKVRKTLDDKASYSEP